MDFELISTMAFQRESLPKGATILEQKKFIAIMQKE